MKTKSLILTALLSVAGSAGLMAQSNVYSLNIVGYINQTIPAGYSMIANQLNASPDNKVSTIFASAPDQTTVFKFDHNSGSYAQAQYFRGIGWFGDDPNMSVSPGEGAFILSFANFTNTYVGSLQLGSTNPIPSGYSLVSSSIPQAGQLVTDLKFPITDQATVFQFSHAQNGYVQNQYFQGIGWFGDTLSGTGEPTIAVAEGFFLLNFQSTNWVRNFAVGP